jgi:anti-sigma B factor antagonist
MADVRYPIEMVNGVPVVAAPAELDISNADWLDAVLREAAARGHGTFAVDMTRTRFCASSGIGVLVRAHKRAVADGGELRLVIPARAAVLRVFAITGIDQVIPNFPSLYEASGTGTSHRPRPPRPDGQPGPVPGSCRGGQVPGRACKVAATGAGTRARSYPASPGEIKSVAAAYQTCESTGKTRPARLRDIEGQG